MLSAAVWSNDPRFYDVLLGGSELTGEIFIKVNCDLQSVIDRFDLDRIPNSEFQLYCGEHGKHKYLCIAGDDIKVEHLRMRAEQILHDHNF
jgi:hypothetical protein